MQVAGSIEPVRGIYWAFRPDATLPPGEYLIESTDGPPLHARDQLRLWLPNGLNEHAALASCLVLAALVTRLRRRR